MYSHTLDASVSNGFSRSFYNLSLLYFSLRSKRFRLVSEQKKKQVTGFSLLTVREMKQDPFFAPSLTLFRRSLLLNRTETLATQASFILA